jgi:RNA-binding protein
MAPLSSRRRSELRSEAHKLSPVVIIGDKGLTDEVLAEIDRSLKAHELIKVRAATDERDARAVWIETICDRLQAHPVQQIGKIFVIYRENPKEEKKTAKPGAAPSALPRGGEDVKRTARPRSRPPSPRPASEPRRRRPRTSR